MLTRIPNPKIDAVLDGITDTDLDFAVLISRIADTIRNRTK
jgi:hypothetical protein